MPQANVKLQHGPSGSRVTTSCVLQVPAKTESAVMAEIHKKYPGYVNVTILKIE
jgi:hypothetical protein